MSHALTCGVGGRIVYHSVPLSRTRPSIHRKYRNGLGLNSRRIMKKSFAKYSMLIGEFYITELGLKVDKTDHMPHISM